MPDWCDSSCQLFKEGKALHDRKTYRIVLATFPHVLSQYLLLNHTIQGDSDFLENQGTKASSIIKSRGERALPWLMMVCMEEEVMTHFNRWPHSKLD